MKNETEGTMQLFKFKLAMKHHNCCNSHIMSVHVTARDCRSIE